MKPEQIVFAISPEGQGDGVPVLLLGVPTAAWEYIRDGKTNTFDLTKVGVPIKLVIFGGADNAAVMKALNDAMAIANAPYFDERHKDLSISEKPKH